MVLGRILEIEVLFPPNVPTLRQSADENLGQLPVTSSRLDPAQSRAFASSKVSRGDLITCRGYVAPSLCQRSFDFDGFAVAGRAKPHSLWNNKTAFSSGALDKWGNSISLAAISSRIGLCGSATRAAAIHGLSLVLPHAPELSPDPLGRVVSREQAHQPVAQALNFGGVGAAPPTSYNRRMKKPPTSVGASVGGSVGAACLGAVSYA